MTRELPISAESLKAMAAFGFFVLWLLAFPMEGPLLQHAPGDLHLFLFLVPHAVALAATGRWLPAKRFSHLSFLSVWAVIGLTLLAGIFPGLRDSLLPVIGLAAAPLSIRAGAILKNCTEPVIAAALGLVMGNLLLLAILHLPAGEGLKYLLVGAGLLALVRFQPASGRQPVNQLLPFLPVVFAFQIVSGLMYRYLMPVYERQALWSGTELLFYLGAVLVVARPVRRHRELILVIGVVLAMTAYLLLLLPGAWGGNLAMFAMQGSAGLVDLFLLSLMLSFANPLRAFGYGNAVLCSGILGGGALDLALGHLAAPVILASQVALNIAVLILYLHSRRHPPATAGSAPPPIPSRLQILLSSQEEQVLQLVLAGATYRDISIRLNISESTVKTYMNRVFDKAGVHGRKDLIRSFLAEVA